MKLKRPSLKGMKHTEYLQRFRKDKFIQDGHNSGPKSPRDTLNPGGRDSDMGGGGGGGSPRRDALSALNDLASKMNLKTRSNEFLMKDRSPQARTNRAREMVREMDKEMEGQSEKILSRRTNEAVEGGSLRSGKQKKADADWLDSFFKWKKQLGQSD